MDAVITLSTSEARLEMPETKRIELYLGYEYAEYIQGKTADGWWHRTLSLNPHHWLRLSGSATMEPWHALQSILAQPDRLPIALPPLLVALFLARSSNPGVSEQRQLFQSVAYAIREAQTVLPLTARQPGLHTMESHELDQLCMVILDALLQQASTVPWPHSDGGIVQVLAHMADVLWTFPPALTRKIPEVAAGYFERRLQADQQWLDDEDTSFEDDDPVSITRWSLLGSFGAMRFWRTPWPTIRGLSLQAPMHEMLFTWYQALVIMHPDAPTIDDVDLAWLCDGMLGAPYDAPFGQLLAACSVIETLNLSLTDLHKRIAVLEQEVAQGTHMPDKRWELSVSTNWTVVKMYGAATVRLVVGAHGCWVRLIPAQWSWGSVLWWRPQSDPPTCWVLAFDDDLKSPCLLTLHEVLWELWRDLHLYGHSALVHGASHP